MAHDTKELANAATAAAAAAAQKAGEAAGAVQDIATDAIAEGRKRVGGWLEKAAEKLKGGTKKEK